MATLSPDTPDPIRLQLPYTLSRRGIEDYVAEKAADPPETFTLELDFTELDKDLRRRAYKIYEREVKEPYVPDWEIKWPERPELDAYTEDPTTVIAAWEAFYAARQAAYDKAAEEYRQKQAILEGKRSIFRVEMARWIGEQGSEQLKLGHERDYRIATSYVRERAALEFPNFEVDTNGRARWQERANPTLKALQLETEALVCQAKIGSFYKIRIAWLVKELSGGEAKKREVIVVPEYLLLYTLIAEVDKPKLDPDEIPF